MNKQIKETNVEKKVSNPFNSFCKKLKENPILSDPILSVSVAATVVACAGILIVTSMKKENVDLNKKDTSEMVCKSEEGNMKVLKIQNDNVIMIDDKVYILKGTENCSPEFAVGVGIGTLLH